MATDTDFDQLLRDYESAIQRGPAHCTNLEELRYRVTTRILLNLICDINQLQQEVRNMATNDAALTQAVTDLASGFDSFSAAITAEVASLKSSTTDSDDPVITTAVANIETIVASMKKATADAVAAVTPPVVATTTATDTPAAEAPAGEAATASTSTDETATS